MLALRSPPKSPPAATPAAAPAPAPAPPAIRGSHGADGRYVGRGIGAAPPAAMSLAFAPAPPVVAHQPGFGGPPSRGCLDASQASCAIDSSTNGSCRRRSSRASASSRRALRRCCSRSVEIWPNHCKSSRSWRASASALCGSRSRSSCRVDNLGEPFQLFALSPSFGRSPGWTGRRIPKNGLGEQPRLVRLSIIVIVEIAIHAETPQWPQKKEPAAGLRLKRKTSYGLFGYALSASSSSDTPVDSRRPWPAMVSLTNGEPTK